MRSRRSKRVDQISSIFSSTDQSRLLRRCCWCCETTNSNIRLHFYLAADAETERADSTFPAIDSQAARGSLISRHFLSTDLLSPHPFYFLPWPSISWKRNYSAIVSVGYRVTSTPSCFQQQFFPLLMDLMRWFIRRTHSSNWNWQNSYRVLSPLLTVYPNICLFQKKCSADSDAKNYELCIFFATGLLAPLFC